MKLTEIMQQQESLVPPAKLPTLLCKRWSSLEKEGLSSGFCPQPDSINDSIKARWGMSSGRYSSPVSGRFPCDTLYIICKGFITSVKSRYCALIRNMCTSHAVAKQQQHTHPVNTETMLTLLNYKILLPILPSFPSLHSVIYLTKGEKQSHYKTLYITLQERMVITKSSNN